MINYYQLLSESQNAKWLFNYAKMLLRLNIKWGNNYNSCIPTITEEIRQVTVKEELMSNSWESFTFLKKLPQRILEAIFLMSTNFAHDLLNNLDGEATVQSLYKPSYVIHTMLHSNKTALIDL